MALSDRFVSRNELKRCDVVISFSAEMEWGGVPSVDQKESATKFHIRVDTLVIQQLFFEQVMQQ
jgi:hypothetical protein